MERENSNFTVEELGRHHLNQEVKVNIVSHVDVTYPLIGCDEKGTSPLMFFPQNPSPQCNYGKTDKLKLKSIQQDT